MNPRIAFATLSLSLLLAACGGQQQTASTLPAVNQEQEVANARPALSDKLIAGDAATAIPGQYIVVLQKEALSGGINTQSLETQGLKTLDMKSLESASLSVQSAQIVSALGLKAQGVTVQRVYGTALSGFAAKLSSQNLEALKADSRVKFIEQDHVVKINATQTGATWGLDRLDQTSLPLDGSYTYPNTASNVTAYIIDTGIYAQHNEYEGRASVGADFVGDGKNGVDCEGHGSHVAGTIGGKTYGVAKGVKLVAVRVLDCNGSGSSSNVLAGINWVAANAVKPAVANMSLGGGASSAEDNAVNAAVAKGIVFAVAAGNDGGNACLNSPARAANAITVASSTRTDARSSFSSVGSCVDIFAPGSSITSVAISGPNATAVLSGTSMASPHVAGAAALVLGANPSFSAAQVASFLTSNAVSGKITDVQGTVNKLLNIQALSGGTTPPPPPPPVGDTFTGTLSATNASSYQPGSTGFSYAGGTLTGKLTGPSGVDFDLYLQKLSGSTWNDVAASEGSTSTESVSYSASSGTYRWQVYSYRGSGAYTLTQTR